MTKVTKVDHGRGSTQFDLPYPPSLNTYYRWTKRGVVISPQGRLYRKQVEHLLMGYPELTGRLAVTLSVIVPDRKERDLDNLCKAVLDSVQHAGVYKSDGQIDRLLVTRDGVQRPGIVGVLVEEIS